MRREYRLVQRECHTNNRTPLSRIFSHALLTSTSAPPQSYVHRVTRTASPPPQAAQFMLARQTDTVPAVLQDAADAFAALTSQPGCASTLASPPLLPPLTAAVLGALGRPQLAEVPKAAQGFLSALMRLVVLLPATDLAAALNAVSSPLIAKLEHLIPQLSGGSNGAEAHAALVGATAGVIRLVQCTLRYLDAAPRLPDDRHASLLVLQARQCN